jgi:hypothetical protein
MRFRVVLGWLAAGFVLVGSSGCAPDYYQAPPASTAPALGFHDAGAGIGLTPPPGWAQQPRPLRASHGYIAGFTKPTVPGGVLVVGGAKDEPIDRLTGESLAAMRKLRPELNDLAREPVTVAGGRAATLVTVGTSTGPEGLLFVVPDGPVDFVVFAYLTPAAFAAESPAVRSALLSFTVDPEPSVDWAGVAIGAGSGLIGMGLLFVVMAAIWLRKPDRRWAELPGWIWISTPLITAGIMGRSVTGPGAEVAAFEDICALWLLVGVIGVFVRWINRRHARLYRG